MTGVLASVDEAASALWLAATSVAIIDLKQPAHGALGALPLATVRDIVTCIAGRKPLSATIGDLPLQPERVFAACRDMAATGVDYVKFGIFPDGDAVACFTALRPLTARGVRLVAVLFADAQPDFALIEQAAQAGLYGVMLDTCEKRHGSLLQHLSLARLREFVHEARQHGLLCGLAGSLRLPDIPVLLPLQPDYLGFRGALCQGQERRNALDPDAVQQVLHAVTASPRLILHCSTSSHALP